jgi:predicted nucleotidyltransferase component of viral defense system
MGRGLIAPVQRMVLCERAQEEFDRFVEINVVSQGQLYGGKICAALDRQHPRDLFDVQYLLENEGFTADIKQGFLYSLLLK